MAGEKEKGKRIIVLTVIATIAGLAVGAVLLIHLAHWAADKMFNPK